MSHEAILDDLRAGLRRRAAVRRIRHAAAGTLVTVALLAAAIAGGADLPGRAASLAASSSGAGADASVLLRGCDDRSRLACDDPLAPYGS